MIRTAVTRTKSDQRFCQISLAHASKVPLLTFDSRQRHDKFDASQSCVRATEMPKVVLHLLPHSHQQNNFY